MSWLFSQALVEEFSQDICLVGEQFVLWNEKATPHKFWYRGKTIKYCPLSPYGMTWKHLTEEVGEELLTLYQEVFLAKTSVSQEKEQELKELEVQCGSKWLELSMKYDLVTHSWKTHRCLFVEDLQPSSVILPKWGTMQGGLFWERTTWGITIAESVYGYLLPTPTASDTNREAIAPEKVLFKKSGIPRRISKKHGPSHQMKLPEAIKTLVEREKVNLPTPTVCGNNNRKGVSATSGDGITTKLKKVILPIVCVSESTGTGKKRYLGSKEYRGAKTLEALRSSSTANQYLNPLFVEWLMGFPITWTSLEVLETHKYHSWQQELLEY